MESLKLFDEGGKQKLNKKKIGDILKNIGEGVEEDELKQFYSEFYQEIQRGKTKKKVE